MDRCRGLKPSINWQLLALRHSHAGRSDGFDHRPRIFLHPGAEFDEEFGHGAVASHCRLGELFVGLVNKWILARRRIRLSDYQYFTFFTWLMFGAAVVFVVVACFYKGRTYLQSQLTADEIATEPILAGGTPS